MLCLCRRQLSAVLAIRLPQSQRGSPQNRTRHRDQTTSRGLSERYTIGQVTIIMRTRYDTILYKYIL